jgi:hypothetical protein
MVALSCELALSSEQTIRVAQLAADRFVLYAREGVARVPACVQELRSEGVLFHPIHDRGAYLDVVLAWRRDELSAVRDGILELVRKNRPEIERLKYAAKVAAREMARCLRRGSAG